MVIMSREMRQHAERIQRNGGQRSWRRKAFGGWTVRPRPWRSSASNDSVEAKWIRNGGEAYSWCGRRTRTTLSWELSSLAMNLPGVSTPAIKALRDELVYWLQRYEERAIVSHRRSDASSRPNAGRQHEGIRIRTDWLVRLATRVRGVRPSHWRAPIVWWSAVGRRNVDCVDCSSRKRSRHGRKSSDQGSEGAPHHFSPVESETCHARW